MIIKKMKKTMAPKAKRITDSPRYTLGTRISSIHYCSLLFALLFALILFADMARIVFTIPTMLSWAYAQLLLFTGAINGVAILSSRSCRIERYNRAANTFFHRELFRRKLDSICFAFAAMIGTISLHMLLFESIDFKSIFNVSNDGGKYFDFAVALMFTFAYSAIMISIIDCFVLCCQLYDDMMTYFEWQRWTQSENSMRKALQNKMSSIKMAKNEDVIVGGDSDEIEKRKSKTNIVYIV